MKIHKVTNIEQFVAKILPKQAQKNKSIVESILKNVQKNGDSAVKKYEKKFTGANLSTLRISKAERLAPVNFFSYCFTAESPFF